MNTVKKALCICFGIFIVVFGLGAAVIFMLLNDTPLANKLLGVSGGLVAVVFGWWLVRRGSNSVWDALGWLLVLLSP